MKRSNVYLPMAALMMTAALAIPLAAQQQVHFKGTFQGKDCVPIQNTGCSAVPPRLPRSIRAERELGRIWENSH